MSENGLHELFQSAYKIGHSTESALIRVQNDALRAIDDDREPHEVRFPPRSKDFSLPRVVPCFPLLGLTSSGLFMGLSSTLIYTSGLILFSTICVPSATRHNIHTLVNSQLVCLPPAGILNLGMLFEIFIIIVCYIGPEKPQWEVANYVYVFTLFFTFGKKTRTFASFNKTPTNYISFWDSAHWW